jgi:hypothetical protein
MEIDVSFDERDREKLQRALGAAEDVDQVAALIARAGARECLAQATGDAVFSTMSDLRSFRIYTFLREGMSMEAGARPRRSACTSALLRAHGAARLRPRSRREGDYELTAHTPGNGHGTRR